MAKAKGATPKKIPGTIIGEANGLKLRRLKLSEIEGADYNPREISDRAFEGLSSSLGTFGLVEFLVWNVRTQRLVGGHQRLRVLAKQGVLETDVVEVDLDDTMEKALLTELNNRAIQGDFTANVADILDQIEDESPELYGALALDDLRLEIPEIPAAGDATLPTTSEVVPKTKTCPECGHVF